MIARLSAEGVTLRYDERTISTNLSLSVPDGSFTVIVGPNACGKSTLLRALSRLLPPASGRIVLDGRSITELPAKDLARRLGLLPQSAIVPDGIAVADLVARGRYPHQSFLRQWSKADELAVEQAMQATQVTDLAERSVDQLSGGQRQRVWIAMVLAQETPILLLDEPTTFLDITHQIELLDLLAQLHGADRTIVAVLHDLNLACRYATHLVAMRDGAVAAEGHPTEIVTENLLAEVFNLPAVIIPDPVTGTPLIVPKGDPTRQPGAPALEDDGMSGNHRLHIGLSLTPTWLRAQSGAEASARQQVHPVDFYLELARRAEAAKLDFVFKPDTLQLHPTMTSGSGASIGLDPTLMLSAIAMGTERIGLVTTASTTFNPPYIVARQLQSLHWISRGRAGWNIVTSIEGAENFSDAPMPDADERYRKAAEFTALVRQLWQSFPPPGDGVGTATAIDHAGEFFSVRGPLNIPGHEAGPPPLFQAGASAVGRRFSAAVADATFAATPEQAVAIELRSDLLRLAEAEGRPAGSLKVLPGLYFFLAETQEEARMLHHRAHAHLTRAQRLQSLHSIIGLDLSSLPGDARVTEELLPDPGQPVRSRTHAELLRWLIARDAPTLDQLLSRPEVIASAHWVAVGTVDDVTNQIAAWFEAGAMDGFIALPGGSEASLALFFNRLVPALAAEGLFRKDYEGATLREHLGIA